MLKNPCHLCGSNIQGNNTHSLCALCIKNPPKYNQLIACFSYEGKIAELINQSKENKNMLSISVILDLLEKRLKNNQRFIEVLSLKEKVSLLAMPSIKSRMIRRGFNLPQLMADRLSKQFQLPLIQSRCIKTTFWSKKQSKLNRDQRLAASHDYIILTKLPKHLVIIDDVMSTGKTMENLVSAVNEKGDSIIDVIVFSKNQ